MIGFFNLRMSLWAKTVIESCSKISVTVYLALVFLLNTVGVVVFEFKTGSESDASTAISLVQTSAALLLILGLILIGTVLLIGLTADYSHVPRLTARTVVFFIGAGLFTMTAHLVRMASSVYIWKNTKDTVSDAILSKPTYYVTGMGFEILTMILYASMRIDLLFATAPSLASIKIPRPTTAESSKSFYDDPLRTNSVVIKSGRSGSLPTIESLTDTGSMLLERDSLGLDKEQGVGGTNKHGSEDSRNGMVIAIQRSFSISSQKKTTARQ